MTATPERYVVTHSIAATPEEIFAVLADPSRHQNTEPPTGSVTRWTPHRSPAPDRSSR